MSRLFEALERLGELAESTLPREGPSWSDRAFRKLKDAVVRGIHDSHSTLVKVEKVSKPYPAVKVRAIYHYNGDRDDMAYEIGKYLGKFVKWKKNPDGLYQAAYENYAIMLSPKRVTIVRVF